MTYDDPEKWYLLVVAAARAVAEPLVDLYEGPMHPGVGHICCDCEFFVYRTGFPSHMGICQEDSEGSDLQDTVDVELACKQFRLREEKEVGDDKE